MASIAVLVLFSFPHTSFAAPPSLLNQLENLLISLIARPQNSTPSVPGISPPLPSSPNVIPGVQSFGGPILPPTPIICTTPPGAIYALVGPPVSKPVICQPGACKIYEAPPPYRTGQYLLGNTAPSPTPIPCIVGITPVGTGFPIGNTPGVGAGRGASPSGISKDPFAGSCAQSQFTITDSVTKQVAENAVRDRLSAAGISVNNVSCGLGQRFQIFRRIFGRGCTDVSGLQCQTTDYLEQLAGICGADSVIITGGSERGHATHDSGDAVDLSTANTGLQSCIDTSGAFEYIGTNRNGERQYRQKGTTAILTQERGEEPHIHVCIPGSGC